MPGRLITALQATWLVLVVSSAIAQEANSIQAERYKPFLGAWKVVSLSGPDDRNESLDVTVVIEAGKFKLSGRDVALNAPRVLEWQLPKGREDQPYRVLRQRGVEGIDDIVDVEHQLWVFWFVGIYKLQENRLELALKYCGQGVEGEHFKTFRPPSTFDVPPSDGETRIVLERSEE